MTVSPRLVLASGSETRARLLRQAGLAVSIVPPVLDEGIIKAGCQAGSVPAGQCAITLAEAKACQVARLDPEALVIGADQILVCDGIWYDKPADQVAARDQLSRLRGRRHELATAVTLARAGTPLWHCLDRACLTMRDFSDAALDAYLAGAGAAAFLSVGAYQLEGPGIQLFAAIAGDYFSILGLPLLPLLATLRDYGIVGR